MEEIWKPIVGYEGMYEISNFGNVISCERKKIYKGTVSIQKSRIMKISTDRYGYKKLILNKEKVKKNFFIHRLVAIAFIENSLLKVTVNHKDGDKNNNASYNLEWATIQEQNIHSVKTGLRVFNNTFLTAKPVIQLSLDGTFINKWSCAKIIKKTLGFSPSRISRCCKNIDKSYRGYLWKFS